MITYEELVKSCSGNSICIVEAVKALVDSGYEFSTDNMKKINALLGEPSRKIDVFNDKYVNVFLKYVQRNCVENDEGDLCIYSWKPGTYIRYFPVSLDATGTILMIKGNNVKVVAYPVHRSHDITGHRVEVPDPASEPIVEVTKRIDGYHITFYYNPVLGKWVPATRYVLHNMMYVKRRLEIRDLGEVINPYASIAHTIAEEKGLYEKLKGFEGWTFTFILEPPEPAILKPNIELYEVSNFNLYLLVARKPDGELLTVTESCKLIEWPCIPVESISINSKGELEKAIEKWRKDLYTRSRFVRFKRGDKYRPYVLEIPSQLYGEAVNVKYMSNPKSLIILASHGYAEEAVNLLVDFKDIRSTGKEIIAYYHELEKLISSIIDKPWLTELLREFNVEKQVRGEIEKAKRTGSYDRLVRKLASLIVGEDLYSGRNKLKELVEKIREKLG
ncbi:MAG: hypothetical protein ABWW65_04985 [Thermoprotei archaeon]